MDDLVGTGEERLEQLATAQRTGRADVDWLARQLVIVLRELDSVEPALERELERHEDF